MIENKPLHQYDCKNCKFNWCCGYTCGCVHWNLPLPPNEIQLQINEARLAAGLPKRDFK